MPFIVDISYPDGASASHQIAADQATIGAAVEADVRIRDAPEIAPVQLLAVERTDGCWLASARDAQVQPLRRGKPFEHGLVPWGTELDIGSVVVRVRRPVEPGARSSSRWSVLIIATALAGTVALWFDGREAEGPPTTTATPPALFDDDEATCPESGRPRQHAGEALAEAEERAARYPYDSQDGLAAATRFREAAACAALAGDPTLAEEASGRAARLAQRIESDYKALRVAIDRARKGNHLERLGALARTLRRYVDHRPGAYRDWLTSVDRYVSTRIERAPRR